MRDFIEAPTRIDRLESRIRSLEIEVISIWAVLTELSQKRDEATCDALSNQHRTACVLGLEGK